MSLHSTYVHVQFFISSTTCHCVKLWIIHWRRAANERHVRPWKQQVRVNTSHYLQGIGYFAIPSRHVEYLALISRLVKYLALPKRHKECITLPPRHIVPLINFKAYRIPHITAKPYCMPRITFKANRIVRIASKAYRIPRIISKAYRIPCITSTWLFNYQCRGAFFRPSIARGGPLPALIELFRHQNSATSQQTNQYLNKWILWWHHFILFYIFYILYMASFIYFIYIYIVILYNSWDEVDLNITNLITFY